MRETKKFKKLKQLWYNRLKKQGFDDLEDGKENLKADTDHRTIARALQVKVTREAYYRIARGFLNTHRFDTPMELKIWERHCEGIGRLSIARELNVTGWRVQETVIKLEIQAKLRRKND